MQALDKSRELRLYAAVALGTAAITIADFLLPVGVSIWVLLFIPIALSKFASRANAPLVAAAGATIALLVGFLAPASSVPELTRHALLNRTFGLVTFWVAAFIGRTFINSRLENEREQYFKAALAALSNAVVGDHTHAELGKNVLRALADHFGASVGAIYVASGTSTYTLSASYASARGTTTSSSPTQSEIRAGEGLVGECASRNELLRVRDVPDGYLDVTSGLGHHRPRELVIAPATVDGRVEAVIELGFMRPLDKEDLELFARINRPIAIAVRAVAQRMKLAELLSETQAQAGELGSREEELRVQNEELEQQTRILQDTQGRLEQNQAELEAINAQLAHQAYDLERQRDEQVRVQDELRQANEYKSEFLANMSHELRTPLNSSLILSKLLAENREKNLTPEQIKFARTINSAGNDLLALINDILDLAKVEAGKLDVSPERVTVSHLLDSLSATFTPMAQEKRLTFELVREEDTPDTILTDPARLQQVLRNLLSNAIKFTARGTVSVHVGRSGANVAFSVRDTGIGIPVDKQETIFEAFRQIEATTNRKYGGTGLGLSISRELARLLGGHLTVESTVGEGSTFTLVVPERYTKPREARPYDSSHRLHAAVADHEKTGTSGSHTTNGSHRTNGKVGDGATTSTEGHVPGAAHAPVGEPLSEDGANGARPTPAIDDRLDIAPGSRSILIIEDDAAFARVLVKLARELNFRCLIAYTGEEGLAMAQQYRPSAIVLDIGLPDISGLSVLDLLKRGTTTRHMPVHVISATDCARSALEMGAVGYAIKPVAKKEIMEAFKRLESKLDQKMKRVLVVEDDPVSRESTCALLAGNTVETVAAASSAEVLDHLRGSTFDCMVLDLTLPDRSGFELLRQIARDETYAFPPVIVYTGKSLTRHEEEELRQLSHSVIIKGARSPERLLDEVTLFLHQVEAELPPERQRMLRDVRHRDALFEGRRVLVVEDDVRNIFALSSALEPKGAVVEIARNGREAVAHVQDNPGIDLVLMDIMMPEMDGLEATRLIRRQPENAKLPIIAITAKAMPDAREKCLTAGANDYIAKPLDVDKLLSLARVWMPK